MHSTSSVPSWYQTTGRPTTEHHLKSAHSEEFENQLHPGGAFWNPSAWHAADGWMNTWPHLHDEVDVHSPHPLDPFTFQSQQTSNSGLQCRPPTPEYNDPGSPYLPLLGANPPKAKQEPELAWLASPTQDVTDVPVLQSPDSLSGDQFGYSQHVSPLERDDSSEATGHSPQSFPRHSSPSLGNFASGNHQAGHPTSGFEHTHDGPFYQTSSTDWLALLSPEPHPYETSPISGMMPDNQPRPNPSFLHYQGLYGVHEDAPNNEQAIPRNTDSSASQCTGDTEIVGVAPVQRTQEIRSTHKLPGSSKLRVTSRESSISSGGSGAEMTVGMPSSSGHGSPLSSAPATSPVDGSPKASGHIRNASTGTGIRKRKDKGSASKAEKSSKSFLPLHIVQEDGLGGSVAPSARIPAPARARRNGPLSVDGRRDAALRRKDRSVCVWCRLAKKKCSGDTPCSTCIEQAKTAMFEQPCVKADFFQIVESGTCNYISQRAVNHLTLDQSTRVRMELPASFEMKQLLSMLDERRGKFNIRARQSWGSLYVIDIDETYRFLEEIGGSGNNSRYNLGDFIDHRVLKSNKWTNCIKDANPMDEIFTLLSQWNNMPSRASYDFIPLNSEDGEQTSQPMDVTIPEHRREILLAAQLSRIMCRKLEVDGYKALQHALNKNKWDDAPYETIIRFVSQLGHILLTLRWRVSWWELLGDGGTQPDLAKERYEDRVRRLCRILYFYYTSVKLKLPAWSTPSNMDGVWSTYADAAPVWEDFPSAATMEGFEAWLARGRDLIHEAGVKGRIATF